MTMFRNPLTVASRVLATIGLILSAYLTYVHYNIDALVCGTGGCELVQTSEYSEMFGIPIAIFGLLMFITLLAGVVVRELRPALDEYISTGMIIILLTAVIYWGYLTWLEANVIHAYCQWCILTSLTTVALLVVEGIRWYRGYVGIGAS